MSLFNCVHFEIDVTIRGEDDLKGSLATTQAATSEVGPPSDLLSAFVRGEVLCVIAQSAAEPYVFREAM